VHAQTIKDSVPHLQLNQINVSGLTLKQQSKSPLLIEAKQLEDLKSIPALNFGEMWSKIPGVYSATSGIGIFKPVIRGMQGNRVVSVWNGMRMEGQQWGNDHGLGITELGFSRIEVIKGPASLIYGSDALGGVIYFKDEDAPATGEYRLKASAQYNTNTQGLVQQFHYAKSHSNIRWNLGMRYGNHADMKLPNGLYLENSRFSELGVNGGISFNSSKGVHHLKMAYAQFRVGLPGHSHDSIPSQLNFQTTAASRVYSIPAQNQENQFVLFDNTWFLSNQNIQLVFGYTKNKLSEFEEKWTIPGIDLSLSNTLAQAKWHLKLRDNLSIISGIQSMYQVNKSGLNASEFLIPNGNVLDYGVYSMVDCSFENWHLQLGGRVDTRQLKTNDIQFVTDAFKKNYSSGNYSLNVLYKIRNHEIRVSGSTGYRSPTYSELLSNGVHHGALRYELGDVNLLPEHANQLDVSAKLNGEHTSLMFNPFFNTYRNYIVLNPIDSSIESLPVFRYEQMKNVQFYGLDVALHHHPHFAHTLHTESNFSIIQTSGQVNVSLLPQPRFTEVIQFNFNSNKLLHLNQLTLEAMWCGSQRNVATFETVTKAYYTIDASVSFMLGNAKQWSVQVGGKNLTNQKYFDHLSRLKNIGIPMPGRSIFITLKLNLDNKVKS